MRVHAHTHICTHARTHALPSVFVFVQSRVEFVLVLGGTNDLGGGRAADLSFREMPTANAEGCEGLAEGCEGLDGSIGKASTTTSL